MLTALRLFHFDANMCPSFHTYRCSIHNCADTSSLKFLVCECKTSAASGVVTFRGNRQTDRQKSHIVRENSLATTSPSDPSSTDEFSISVRPGFAGNTFRLVSFGDGGHGRRTRSRVSVHVSLFMLLALDYISHIRRTRVLKTHTDKHSPTCPSHAVCCDRCASHLC